MRFSAPTSSAHRMADITQDFRFRSSTVRENWTLPIAMSQVRQGFELRLSGAIEILVPFTAA
jgi:hypothetical protein